jgi:hypothetical protein
MPPAQRRLFKIDFRLITFSTIQQLLRLCKILVNSPLGASLFVPSVRIRIRTLSEIRSTLLREGIPEFQHQSVGQKMVWKQQEIGSEITINV